VNHRPTTALLSSTLLIEISCLATIVEIDRRSGQGITLAIASENSGSCFAIEGQMIDVAQ
jgi:hypothetical protein